MLCTQELAHLKRSDEPGVLRCSGIIVAEYLYTAAILCHVIVSYTL